MIMSYIIVAVSFILTTVVNNFLPYVFNQIVFFPMFVLVGLIAAYFYSKNNKRFLILSFLSGFMIDNAWTNTTIIYGVIYLALGYIIIKINYIFVINIINYMVEIILFIIMENIIVYGLLVMLNYTSYSIIDLIIKISKSIPLSLVYGIIVYFVLDFFGKKKNFKKRY